MKAYTSLEVEALRIKWRRDILDGKHGDVPRKRLYAMVIHGFPEKLCV